ncbi:MAG: DUF2784 family protein [bacterium]
MYPFLDKFFILFHSLLILFNLFGWIWKKTRRLNLIILLLTGASWFILGIFYGIGFCPLTEWHWNVLEKLGQQGLPDSYVTYLIWRMTGFLPDEQWVDILTVVLYFLALAASVLVNVLLRKKTSN